MPKRRRYFGMVWSLLLLSASICLAGMNPSPVARSQRVQPEALFEKNLGQFTDAIAYVGHFSDMDVVIRRDATLEFHSRRRAYGSSSSVTLSLVNKPDKPVFQERDVDDFTTNYFDASSRISAVPHYKKLDVSLGAGMGALFRANGRVFEFDIEIPRAVDAEKFAMRVSGALDPLRVDPEGNLIMRTEAGILRQQAPRAFQTVDGEFVPVPCEYRLIDSTTFSFHVASRNMDQPVTIDPIVDFATYVGGTGSVEMIGAVAIGADGSLYVAGPGTADAYASNATTNLSGNSSNLFVAKINPTTGRAVYLTRLGPGTLGGMAIDSAGSVYIVGSAGSRYPTTSGAYQTRATSSDGFVTKLSSSGTTLAYSTLLAGATPYAVTIDATGKAVVAGHATSAFISTAGALQSAYGGDDGSSGSGDAFVLRLNAGGTGVDFATFLGGSSDDNISAVALDAAGRIVVAGSTGSLNFPIIAPFSTRTTTGPPFIAALSPAGNTLIYSSYLQGGGRINSVAADPYGNIVIAGEGWALPTVNALNNTSPPTGYLSSFVAKISAPPANITFLTYVFPAYMEDSAVSVAADRAGDIYVGGKIDWNFIDRYQALNAFAAIDQLQFTGFWDVSYVVGISRDGQALRFSTPICLNQGATSLIATRGIGEVFAGCATSSPNQAVAPSNGQTTLSTVSDGYAVTLELADAPLVLRASKAKPAAGETVTLSATSYSTSPTGSVTFSDGATTLGSAPLVEGIAKFSTSFSNGVHRLSATLGSTKTADTLLPVSLAP